VARRVPSRLAQGRPIESRVTEEFLMPDADWPSEPRASDHDDDHEAATRETREDLAALQARVERLLDPANATSTSSSAVESAARASVATTPTLRAEDQHEASPVAAAVSFRDAASSDLAARLREMEGAERTRPPGPDLKRAPQAPAPGPSFDLLRRAITEELPDDEDDDDGDDRYRNAEDLEAALAGDDDPFERAYEDDETEEVEAIDAHAYQTRVRIVVLIQVVTAIACGLLALLHVTGVI
jgi:hypothetical protein